jgi:branched-chain amino acid transport system ATP-binding protein
LTTARRTRCLISLQVVRRLSDRVIVLHNGALVAGGGPAEVAASAIVREVHLGIRAAF